MNIGKKYMWCKDKIEKKKQFGRFAKKYLLDYTEICIAIYKNQTKPNQV